MWKLKTSLAFLLALAGNINAATLPTTNSALDPNHGPNNRQCWDGSNSIDTDFNHQWPSTGKTVYYNLEITNVTCSPDGHNPGRYCMLVNGQYPAPTIYADWGDTLVVYVKNSMQNNGTSIHWHGVLQTGTNPMDGVNGVTECALAPGDSKVYTFQANQHGTSWYHSHFSAQYGDGVAGALVFRGPTTANYDVDLGAYPITDWTYDSAWAAEYLTLASNQGIGKSPSLDTILINGTNKNAQGGGQYNVITIESGKKYLLRLINMATDNFIDVTLDGHPFQIVAADFVPIKPISVDRLMFGAGQRYDVIIHANQTAGNYWFRAENSTGCGSTNKFYGRAIWTYSTVPTATPNSTALAEQPKVCREPAPLVPQWYSPISQKSFNDSVGSLAINRTNFKPNPGGYQPPAGNSTVVLWSLDAHAGTSMNVNWSDPTLAYVLRDNQSFPAEMSVIPTLRNGETTFWVMQQAVKSSPHPIHLHGHDFSILGTGTGTFNISNATLNFENPTRRDTTTIYTDGWLAIAFETHNPGAWLMHCHISTHVSGGFGVQFLSSPDQIRVPYHRQFEQQCRKWSKYAKTAVYRKDDSGV